MGNEKVKIYSSKELTLKDFPQKKYFLRPLFFPGSLSMLYASPGIGKTFTALWMAAAIAGEGYFLKWKSEAKGRVLYVDGEMGLEGMQSRLNQLIVGIDFELDSDGLNFVSPDEFNHGEIPLISDLASHEAYLQAMGKRDVIIFDNYDCLTARAARQTDEDVWSNSWKLIKKLRAAGKSVLIIHHAGKAGNQLGTSKKEQPLDFMIELRRPATYEPTQGATFELKFTKVRGVKGEDVENLLVNLIEYENGVKWEWRALETEFSERVRKMKDVGMTDGQIALETNRPLFFIKSILKNTDIDLPTVGRTDFYDDTREDLF